MARRVPLINDVDRFFDVMLRRTCIACAVQVAPPSSPISGSAKSKSTSGSILAPPQVYPVGTNTGAARLRNRTSGLLAPAKVAQPFGRAALPSQGCLQPADPREELSSLADLAGASNSVPIFKRSRSFAASRTFAQKWEELFASTTCCTDFSALSHAAKRPGEADSSLISSTTEALQRHKEEEILGEGIRRELAGQLSDLSEESNGGGRASKLLEHGTVSVQEVCYNAKPCCRGNCDKGRDGEALTGKGNNSSGNQCLGLQLPIVCSLSQEHVGEDISGIAYGASIHTGEGSKAATMGIRQTLAVAWDNSTDGSGPSSRDPEAVLRQCSQMTGDLLPVPGLELLACSDQAPNWRARPSKAAVGAAPAAEADFGDLLPWPCTQPV